MNKTIIVIGRGAFRRFKDVLGGDLRVRERWFEFKRERLREHMTEWLASLDIEPGKTLIIKLNAVGKVQSDGTRTVYFELNGNNRSVVIRDQSVQSDEAVRIKADKDNPCHIAAPMPGKVLKVNVKPGDAIKAGDVLMVTEAMKMETNIKAKADGAVADVKFKEGDKVEKEDLIIVITG